MGIACRIAQLHRLAERIGAGKARAIGLAGFSEDDRLVLVDQIGKAGEGAERRLVAGIREEIIAAYRLLVRAEAVDAPDGAVGPGVGQVDLQILDRSVLNPARIKRLRSEGRREG